MPDTETAVPPVSRDSSGSALLGLMAELDARGYDFVSVTPATHRRFVERAGRRTSRDLRDVLGWSLPVEKGVLPRDIETALVEAGVLVERPEGDLKPVLRLSRVESLLFWHSAYPTQARDAVFLGPDSYRFAQLIARNLDDGHRTILDYGAGTGVGGIVAATRLRGASLTIADINPRALQLAAVNARYAGVPCKVAQVSTPGAIADTFDLIVTNPPFMMDADHRTYRDGGSLHGAELSLDWALTGMDLLAPAGRLIMYTGVSVIAGRDILLEQLRRQLDHRKCTLAYSELDPDIFGDELDQPAYAEVERIAAVGLVLQRRASRDAPIAGLD